MAKVATLATADTILRWYWSNDNYAEPFGDDCDQETESWAGLGCGFSSDIGGGQNLTVRSLVKIADVFGVPVTELFRRPKTKQAGPGRPKVRRKAVGGSPRQNRPVSDHWVSPR